MRHPVGSRTPDAGLLLSLPPAPRILVMAGRCAVWVLHGVLLLWAVAHAADAWQQRSAWLQAGLAVGLVVLMLVLWWRLPAIGWLDRTRHLAPAHDLAPALRQSSGGSARRLSHWVDLEPPAHGRPRGSDPDTPQIALRVLLDTGGAMLIVLQEGAIPVVTWLPQAALTPTLRWQLLGAGPGSVRG